MYHWTFRVFRNTEHAFVVKMCLKREVRKDVVNQNLYIGSFSIYLVTLNKTMKLNVSYVQMT